MNPRPFEATTTRQQREAAAEARANQHYTAPEVARMAADGKLEWEGQTLEPFTISSDYVRKLGAELVRARAGQRPSPLAKMQPRDAIEALRVRLINLADAELRQLEKQPAGKRDLAKIRDAARCIKEAASIQPPKETQARPGERTGQDKPAGEMTRTGSTGMLLQAHRGVSKPDAAPETEDRASEAPTTTGHVATPTQGRAGQSGRSGAYTHASDAAAA